MIHCSRPLGKSLYSVRADTGINLFFIVPIIISGGSRFVSKSAIFRKYILLNLSRKQIERFTREEIGSIYRF